MRAVYKLHRCYSRIEGESICNPISNEDDLISNPSFINDFYNESDFLSRFRAISMIDFRYAKFKESINENFRPFKKRR